MRLRRAGECGALVELADLDAVHRLTAALRAAGLPGVVEVVPGFRTVLVTTAEPQQLELVRDVLPQLPIPEPTHATGRLVEVPVVYDGEDLPEVQRRTGPPRAEVVARHTAPEYVVALLGFTPGFPYLTGLDPALHVPRRATPRTVVPAGAVGLGGTRPASTRARPRVAGTVRCGCFSGRGTTP